jgi:5-methylcytosine-specific restriction endonuclease McrA
MRLWREANPDKHSAGVRKWHQANRERIKEYRRQPAEKAKAAEHLRKWKEQHPGYRQSYREYDAAYQKTFHAAHPGYRRTYYLSNLSLITAQTSLWRDRNRGKVCAYMANYRAKKRENGGTLSANIIEILMDRQKGQCRYCTAVLSKGNRHLDHIYPISRGGVNTDDNVQLLCRFCNLSKSDKDPIVFMQSLGLSLKEPACP